jgi:hypothetical protein
MIRTQVGVRHDKVSLPTSLPVVKAATTLTSPVQQDHYHERRQEQRQHESQNLADNQHGYQAGNRVSQ